MCMEISSIKTMMSLHRISLLFALRNIRKASNQTCIIGQTSEMSDRRSLDPRLNGEWWWTNKTEVNSNCQHFELQLLNEQKNTITEQTGNAHGNVRQIMDLRLLLNNRTNEQTLLGRQMRFELTKRFHLKIFVCTIVRRMHLL